MYFITKVLKLVICYHGNGIDSIIMSNTNVNLKIYNNKVYFRTTKVVKRLKNLYNFVKRPHPPSFEVNALAAATTL